MGVVTAPTRVHAQYDAPVVTVIKPETVEATSTPVAKKAVKKYDFVACNCYALLKQKIPNLPMMNQIVPNSPPTVGGAVVMNYYGIPHVAYIVGLTEDGVVVEESNYHHCKYDTRTVSWTDKALLGFWTPESGLNSI